jgi:hypothetical protein
VVLNLVSIFKFRRFWQCRQVWQLRGLGRHGGWLLKSIVIPTTVKQARAFTSVRVGRRDLVFLLRIYDWAFWAFSNSRLALRVPGGSALSFSAKEWHIFVRRINYEDGQCLVHHCSTGCTPEPSDTAGIAPDFPPCRSSPITAMSAITGDLNDYWAT